MSKEYEQAYKKEYLGGDDPFGIDIRIRLGRALTRRDSAIVNRYADQIEDELMRESVRVDPERIKAAAQERAEIIGLFGDRAIYVEEIPNGYHSAWYTSDRPWFVVTTNLGRIKIGWRKRVINIDWSDTRIDKSPTLFDDQPAGITRGEGYIHAWSLAKAGEYLQRILRG